MSGIIVDTSVWIDFFAGRPVPSLEDALSQGAVVLSPIVVAELVSGARKPKEREAIEDLLDELPLHATPLEHWIHVGELRRTLAARGLTVSTPDAHVAQCALDRQCVLLARDEIFRRMAPLVDLRVRTD